jgi:NADH-quinone oxidoreductase subunit A
MLFGSTLYKVPPAMNPYLPVLIVLVLGVGLGCILSALAHFIGPRPLNKVDDDPFECGVPAVGERDKMSVKFYLTGILFILFDIETVFLYLWAVAFKQLGWFGVSEIIVFLVILFAGYIYVVKRGALEWD